MLADIETVSTKDMPKRIITYLLWQKLGYRHTIENGVLNGKTD